MARDALSFSSLRGRPFQLIAAFTCTLSAISDGMHYGWTSPIVPQLLSKSSPFKITDKDILWLENTYMLGGVAGLLFTIICVEKLGRKKSVLIASIMSIVSWMLIACTKSLSIIYFARFTGGLAGDICVVSAPMYIAEMADKKIRGFLGSCQYIMMLLGILVVYSVAPYVSIAASSCVGMLFLTLQLVTFPFMPESPHFLILEGKKECARRCLRQLRSGSEEDLELELQEMIAHAKRAQAESMTLGDFFGSRPNRRAFLIVIFLNAAEHFGGISVMLMNLHAILESVEANISSNVAAVAFSALMLLAGATSASLMDKLGRKFLLICSSALTGTCLLILGSYFAIKDADGDVTGYTWVPIAATLVYAAAFKYGMGMVPIVLSAELFPASFKSIGMTFGDTSYVSFSVASIFLYQMLSKTYGMHAPFFVFAASCLCTVVFTAFFIPETKHRSLEEIQKILGQKEDVENNNQTDNCYSYGSITQSLQSV